MLRAGHTATKGSVARSCRAGLRTGGPESMGILRKHRCCPKTPTGRASPGVRAPCRGCSTSPERAAQPTVCRTKALPRSSHPTTAVPQPFCHSSRKRRNGSPGLFPCARWGPTPRPDGRHRLPQMQAYWPRTARGLKGLKGGGPPVGTVAHSSP